jgi:protein-S-isoprenylcysteine O-methyltransferase Ste14
MLKQAMALTLSTMVWPLIVFCAFWGITSLFVKKNVEKQKISEWFYYWIFSIIGAVLLFVPSTVPALANLPILGIALTRNSFTLEFLGFLIEVLGLCLAIWARITLGRNWSASVAFKKKHELITNGPYRLVRHPIYTGMIGMFLGFAIYTGVLAGFIGVLLIAYSFWIKLRQEERLMARHFPKEYAAYRKRTKTLVPFVY